MLQKLVVIHSMQVARGHALRQVLYQLLRQVLRQALSQVLCQSSLNSENGSVSFYTLPKIFSFKISDTCQWQQFGFYNPKRRMCFVSILGFHLEILPLQCVTPHLYISTSVVW